MKNKTIEQTFQEMFCSVCYACHNADPGTKNHKTSPPAILIESGWAHASKNNATGYIHCYASNIRTIAMKYLKAVPK